MNIPSFIRAAVTALVFSVAEVRATPFQEFSQYTDCQQADLSEGVKSHLLCFRSNDVMKKLHGAAVDGNSNLRLAVKGLRKLEFDNGQVLYETIETAFDCNRNRVRARTQVTVFSGSSFQKKPMSSWDDGEEASPGLAKMVIFCPAEKGFVRVGGFQVKTKDVLRRGSLVNTVIKDSSGRMQTLSIDCNKLKLTNGSVTVLIRPGSNGQQIFNLLCKV